MVNKDYAHKFKVGSSAEMSFQNLALNYLLIKSSITINGYYTGTF